jgi:glyoxylase-like metal-dependent hydrolase (beta-lactamase superfamily II)
MIFRQLFDTETSTYTYLLADKSEAVLIDCVFEQHLRDLALIRELDLKLLFTLETHVHADHVTGGWLMKQVLDSRIALSADSGAKCVDLALKHGDVITFGDISLEVRSTPGHTNGCLSFVMADKRMVFSGDALLIRGAGRTDFQEGSAESLYKSIHEQIYSLPDECLIYPAHDYSGRTVTTVAEEKAYNPRLGENVREQDFKGYMENLGLPHPKQLDIAVPANLRCGQPEGDQNMPHFPEWGPVIRTFAGVWQVEAEWVYQHIDSVRVIDVRENAEVEASLMGKIEGSTVLPLSELRERSDEVENDLPVICVCPAGARSAIAAGIFEKAGISKVANLRGGLLAWRSLGLPINNE